MFFFDLNDTLLDHKSAQKRAALAGQLPSWSFKLRNKYRSALCTFGDNVTFLQRNAGKAARA